MIPVIPGCRGQIGIKNTLYEIFMGGLDAAPAALDPVYGHEQGGTRPVLVLQNDVGNYYSPTLIVTAATRRTFKKPTQPTHVVLDDVEGLDPSLFMLEVIRTIDKRRVRGYVGKLTGEQMEQIDAALRVSLHLDEDAFLPTELEAP